MELSLYFLIAAAILVLFFAKMALVIIPQSETKSLSDSDVIMLR